MLRCAQDVEINYTLGGDGKCHSAIEASGEIYFEAGDNGLTARAAMNILGRCWAQRAD